MNKNDLIMIGVTLSLMQVKAEEEAQELEAQALDEGYDNYDLEIERHEARGYAAGLAAAFDLIKTRVEQAA